jgi:hypothetical protein
LPASIPPAPLLVVDPLPPVPLDAAFDASAELASLLARLLVALLAPAPPAPDVALADAGKASEDLPQAAMVRARRAVDHVRTYMRPSWAESAPGG